MQQQTNKNNYYNKVTDDVELYFPQFSSVFDKDDDVYPILGDLGNYIIEHINKPEVIIQAATFINNALKQECTKTEDAIVIQLFQQFYANDEATKQIRILLSDKAMKIYDNYYFEYKKWHIV